MPTVRELLQAGIKRLRGDEARRDAEVLLGCALGRSWAWLIAHAGDVVEPTHAVAFDGLIARRARGEPVAYITGRRGFHALELAVTPDVLIPRPETELLVDIALQRIMADHGFAVADLGTGSGAVALAIAKARPHVSVLATDASGAALEVARCNAERLGLRNVTFAHGDWCAALGSAQFNLIVSNPPYVAEGDPHLRQGDLRVEPRMALTPGADALDAIRSIVHAAPEHLHAGGWLLLEHGFGQGRAVRGLLAGAGFGEVFTARDLEGRERVSGARRL